MRVGVLQRSAKVRDKIRVAHDYGRNKFQTQSKPWRKSLNSLPHPKSQFITRKPKEYTNLMVII